MKKLSFSWVIDGELAGHRAPTSEQDLQWLKQQGVLSLVRMAEEQKAEVDSLQIIRLGFWDCHKPVLDFSAPNQAQIDAIVAFISDSLAAAKPVGVSCGAGFGRTGTILACYLVNHGYTASAAIDEVRTKRPGSIETQSQEKAIMAYAKLIR